MRVIIQKYDVEDNLRPPKLGTMPELWNNWSNVVAAGTMKEYAGQMYIPFVAGEEQTLIKKVTLLTNHRHVHQLLTKKFQPNAATMPTAAEIT